MTGLQHVSVVRPTPDRPTRRSQSTGSARRRNAAEMVIGLAVAAAVVISCLEVPRIAWLGLLVVALVLLDVALGLGFRQWVRDRAR